MKYKITLTEYHKKYLEDYEIFKRKDVNMSAISRELDIPYHIIYKYLKSKLQE